MTNTCKKNQARKSCSSKVRVKTNCRMDRRDVILSSWPLHYCTLVSYFSVIFQSSLSFAAHVDYVLKVCSQRILKQQMIAYQNKGSSYKRLLLSLPSLIFNDILSRQRFEPGLLTVNPASYPSKIRSIDICNWSPQLHVLSFSHNLTSKTPN